MLQVYILALAVLTPNGWDVYHYREDGKNTTVFVSKQACEKKKAQEALEVDKLSNGVPYVLNCVPLERQQKNPT